jgi:hypothetical protein
MNDVDGGVYLFCKGQGDSGHARLHLPNGTSVEFAFDEGGWNRYKMSFDFTAYDGEGAVTVFVKPGCTGEWIQQAAATNVNMHLTPGSGDKNDYRVWDGLFFHSQGGTGGFDNLLVRQQPDGNAQLIEMEDIPNQLVFNDPITLQATASSGLPVSFEMIEGPATISGNILTLAGTEGVVRFKASQAGNDIWLPAPDVVKTFEVVDPDAYDPEVIIRRPYDGTKVYLDGSHPVMIVVSAYIDHPEVIKFTEVVANVDGVDIPLTTDYPDDPDNGYYYGLQKQLNDVSDKNFFRSSEAYLNLAEAMAYMGKETEARNAVNTLRKYRFTDGADYEITSTGNKLIEDIRDERERELLLEGHRWFDLRRYAVNTKYQQKTEITHHYYYYEDRQSDVIKSMCTFKLSADDWGWVLPLPQSVIDYNVGMPQNTRGERTYTTITL